MITVSRAALNDALRLLKPSTKDMLRLEAAGDVLTLHTDGFMHDHWVVARVPFIGDEHLPPMVVSPKLIAIVGRFTCERISLQLDGTRLVITGDGTARIPADLRSDWKLPGAEKAEHWVIVEAAELRQRLAWVSLAQSRDDMRPQLRGVRVRPNGVIEATDGHRLHSASGYVGLTGSGLKGILPSGTVAAWLRALAHANSATVDSAGTLTVDGGAVSIVTQFVAGWFPDTKAIWPEDEGTAFAWPVETKAAVQRALQLDAQNPMIHVTVDGEQIIVAKDSHDNTYREAVACGQEIVPDEPAKFAINGAYLNEALPEGCELGRLMYRGAENAVVVATDNGTAIIMPMRA